MDDNFKCIYKILSALEKDMDLQEFDLEKISFNTLGISKERWVKYIQMMVDSEYIKGIRVYYDCTGELEVDNSGISLTLKGLEYLTENSIMQRIYKSFMSVKDVIK